MKARARRAAVRGVFPVAIFLYIGTETKIFELDPSGGNADRMKGSVLDRTCRGKSLGGLVMSAERKKLLWISISLGVFVLVVLTVGFFFLSPRKGGAQAPATVSNSAPPKAQDPQDFLSAPPPAPSLEQPKTPDGSMIVVYGDKPNLGAAAGSASTANASTPLGSGSQTAASSSSPQNQTGAVPTAQTAVGAAGTESSAGTAAPAKAAAGRSPKKAMASKVAPAKAASAGKPKPARANEYWIQAASFTSRGRADELKQSLSDKGISALIVVKDVSGKSYYRLRIGPYSAKTEADGWLGQLKGLPGCDQAYVSEILAEKPKD
jgi:DedD protein